MRIASAVLLFVVITLGSALAAPITDIQCGDVLGPGGRFRLEHDLVCTLHALTVDSALLDLNEHTVTCPHPSIDCIILTGVGAQLQNGTVEGGHHVSILVIGTGGHTVRNVTSTLVDGNIRVFSDNNRLINVMAESVFNPAFLINGDNNRLTNNSAFCIGLFGAGCIFVGGSGNHLVDNFATSTVSASMASGFQIAGHNNRLRGNEAINNEQRGIVVMGTGNDLRHNIAVDNALDLQDTNGDCAHNSWKHNVFATRAPACIE